MENIILSMWIFAGSLQVAFLVALIAIAQTLRRSIGIWSPFWIVIFFFLQSLGADLSHSRRNAGDKPLSHWVQRFESVGHHRLGIGLATVLLAAAHPTLLVGLLLSTN